MRNGIDVFLVISSTDLLTYFCADHGNKM